MSSPDTSNWDSLQWRRRLECFGEDDSPLLASGPNGEVHGVWQVALNHIPCGYIWLMPFCSQFGELTDKGRETTFALGQRLRHLYVDQLRYMPSVISSSESIYLRSTPLPRALESVQQVFWGMYPLTARTKSFPPPTIVTRTPADETLFPNENSCRRFNRLSIAFAQRAADKWNHTEEMRYVDRLISAWMPPSSPKVAVDSHPRLSGIMDTINASLAHGPMTRLPPEFYDPKAREIIEKIGVDEWYSGYNESREYRALGIGPLIGDIVERMTASIEQPALTTHDIDGHGKASESMIKFAMSGCHDTTIAGVLASLGVFGGELWPPFTSHIALELFCDREQPRIPEAIQPRSATEKNVIAAPTRPGWFASLLGLSSAHADKPVSSKGIGRRPTSSLSATEKSKLNGHYVRIRYNDRIMTIPGCRKPGNHLDGDESLCTMAAFKAITDEFTPKNWKQECDANLDSETIKPVGKEEWAGYAGAADGMAGPAR